jgi:hypothetical protein
VSDALELDTDAHRTAPEHQSTRQLRRAHDRRPVIRLYELLVSVPVVAYLIWSVWTEPHLFTDWHMYAWALAVMVADLLPVPTNVSMGFSLSFPLELSAALLFPTPTAAAIAFLGATDARELKGEIPPSRRCSFGRRSPSA